MKYVYFSYVGINSVIGIMWIHNTWWNKPLISMPNYHEVVPMVAQIGRCGCAIVMSYIRIKKAVSQWLSVCLDLWPAQICHLTLNLCISLALHAPHEIIDMQRNECDDI